MWRERAPTEDVTEERRMLREMHGRAPDHTLHTDGQYGVCCAICGPLAGQWPCPTIRAMDELVRLRRFTEAVIPLLDRACEEGVRGDYDGWADEGREALIAAGHPAPAEAM